MELNFGLPGNSDTNKRFIELIVSVVKTDKNKLIEILSHDMDLEILKEDLGKKEKINKLLNSLVEFIGVLKENPSVMTAVLGDNILEIKPTDINLEKINQFLMNIKKDIM